MEVAKLTRWQFLTLLLASIAWAKTAVPAYEGPVNDHAKIMSAEDRKSLNRSLRTLLKSGGSQLAVLTIPDLGAAIVEDYSIQVTDSWRLGDKVRDDGILLLIAPNERKIRIEVGLGLESVLTDLVASRIIRETIAPYFKQSRFSEGIVAGVAAILAITDPSFSSYRRSADSQEGSPSLHVERRWYDNPLPFFFAMAFVSLIFDLRRKGKRGEKDGSRMTVEDSWNHVSFPASSSHADTTTSSSSGGGGSFSGGGASGSW